MKRQAVRQAVGKVIITKNSLFFILLLLVVCVIVKLQVVRKIKAN